ncbi:MAG: hypothetical protein OK454_11905 [Thaumarchaeota archaeon]|nr:hypothetical protein [Nitrososphaerota archaeon]
MTLYCPIHPFAVMFREDESHHPQHTGPLPIGENTFGCWACHQGVPEGRGYVKGPRLTLRFPTA